MGFSGLIGNVPDSGGYFFEMGQYNLITYFIYTRGYYPLEALIKNKGGHIMKDNNNFKRINHNNDNENNNKQNQGVLVQFSDGNEYQFLNNVNYHETNKNKNNQHNNHK